VTKKLNTFLAFAFGLATCSFVGMLTYYYPVLNFIEVCLAAVVGLVILFLIYESMSRGQHQSDEKQILKEFCRSQELVLKRMEKLEARMSDNVDGLNDGFSSYSQSSNSDLLSEIKVLQNLITDLSDEASGSTVHETKKTVNYQTAITPSGDIVEQAEGYLQANNGCDGEEGGPSPHETMNREQLLMHLKDALEKDRIEMLLQPIVSLPQRKPRNFECFSRIKTEDGTIIIPDHYIGIAEKQSLIRIIDNTLLFRCIQMIRKTLQKNFNVRFFANVSIATLRDQVFFDSFVEFVSQNRQVAPNLIFEFDGLKMSKAPQEVLDSLTSLTRFGCSFSLDQVTSLDVDLKTLAKHNFKYIKIDADVFMRLLKEEEGHKKITKFKQAADQHNIDIILTRVEDEQPLKELLDFNFDYGQGYLFGAPKLSRK